jgi:hypothetical protein
MIDVYTAFDGLDKVDIDRYKSRTRELVVRYDDIKHLLKWHLEVEETETDSKECKIVFKA